MRKSIKVFLIFVFVSFFFLSPGDASSISQTKPNIIVIMADDLSKELFDRLVDNNWMPNVKEHIIDKGVRFENAFVTNAVCCPSRATFLTGLYSHNHKVYSNKSPDPVKAGIIWPGWFPTEETPGLNESTIATCLKQEGYWTGYIGKYLNGYGLYGPYNVDDPQKYIPPGWDDWQGLIDPTTYNVYDYSINDNGQVIQYGDSEKDYQTDVLADRAVNFIESSSQSDKPFFLTISPLAPHVEVFNIIEMLKENDIYRQFEAIIRPAPRHEYLIDDDLQNNELPEIIEKPSLNENDMTEKPACSSSQPPYGISMNYEPYCIGDYPLMRTDHPDMTYLQRQYKSMSASMLAIDDMIGRIIEILQSESIIDKTVILFTSDNGWLYGEHRTVGKELAYEESIRVPLVVVSPFLEKNSSKAQQIILNNDLAPTLAEIGGTALSHTPDGKSFVSILENPQRTDWHRHTFLIEHWFIPSLIKFQFPTSFALRHISDNLNYLFVITYADRDNPNVPTHREFYELNLDPYQVGNITLPPEVISNLDLYTTIFRTCYGGMCTVLESY